MPAAAVWPTPLDAALVDLDGTMVDTLGDFEVALNRSLHDLELPPVDRAFIERTVGKGSEHLIRSTLQAVAAPDAYYDAAWAGYQQHYRAINGEFAQVYPGVADGLRSLREAGLRLVCLTNKPQAFAQALLQRKGLDGHFAACFGGDSFARRKPDPMPLLESCAYLRVAPARTLMIGDSRNDAAAARAAGCPVLLVSYGYNHGEPVAAVGADRVVDSLAQWQGA
jgi:phosphoglycolate phosphatase